MSKSNEKALMRAAISELEKLSRHLGAELEATAGMMSIEEVEDDLREMGLDPNRPVPAKLTRLIFEEAGERRGPEAAGAAGERRYGAGLRRDGVSWPFHVYVSNESLQGECTDEVKLLILSIRHLARHGRYKDALRLAEKAARLEPNYWRAQITLATLSVLFGKVDEGAEIFERVSRDFPDNPRAVGAGLHGCGWVKEIRYALNPSEEALGEAASSYAGALQSDALRANTRACLLINVLKSDKVDNDQKLLEESLLSEGFLEQMELELNAHLQGRDVPGVSAGFFEVEKLELTRHHMEKALQALRALRDFLFPISPPRADGYGY